MGLIIGGTRSRGATTRTIVIATIGMMILKNSNYSFFFHLIILLKQNLFPAYKSKYWVLPVFYHFLHMLVFGPNRFGIGNFSLYLSRYSLHVSS